MPTDLMPSYSHHNFRRVPWVLVAVAVMLPILATLGVFYFRMPA